MAQIKTLSTIIARIKAVCEVRTKRGREVLIVSHREPRLTLHRRGDDGRRMSLEAAAGETIALASTGGQLSVDDVYRDGLEDA